MTHGSNRRAAYLPEDAIASLRNISAVKWQRLPDGRYLGRETMVIIQNNVLHECRFGGGGNAGDRSPVPSEPPPRAASVERDLPST